MNRSEELCKLLGIEPKCLNEEYSGCKYADDDTRKCCKEYKEKTCKYSNFWIYPDLTKPSNFVKLLEDIKIDGIELCDWLITYQGSFCNRENFIKKLILIIKQDLKCLNSDIKIIKQQAQATKWDY